MYRSEVSYTFSVSLKPHNIRYMSFFFDKSVFFGDEYHTMVVVVDRLLLCLAARVLCSVGRK